MGLLTRHRLRNVAIDVALLFVAWYAAFFFRFDTISPYWAHLRDVAGWRFVGVQVAVLIVPTTQPEPIADFTNRLEYNDKLVLSILAQKGNIFLRDRLEIE